MNTKTKPEVDYLIEKKLYPMLCRKYGESKVTSQFRLPNKKIVDYMITDIEFTTEPGKTVKTDLVVEFDGYRHYSENAVITRDLKNHILFNELGIHSIHIPYWLQADTAIPFYFNTFSTKEFYDSKTNAYPDGFIDSKCMKPIDFSFDGWIRFIYERDQLPTCVREQINSTMTDKELSIMDHFRSENFASPYEDLDWNKWCLYG